MKRIDFDSVAESYDLYVRLTNDISCYPVDFDGETSLDGKSWTTFFRVEGSIEARRIKNTFPPIEMQHFKLSIRSSANPKYPNAAQVCEIEPVKSEVVSVRPELTSGAWHGELGASSHA